MTILKIVRPRMTPPMINPINIALLCELFVTLAEGTAELVVGVGAKGCVEVEGTVVSVEFLSDFFSELLVDPPGVDTGWLSATSGVSWLPPSAVGHHYEDVEECHHGSVKSNTCYSCATPSIYNTRLYMPLLF